MAKEVVNVREFQELAKQKLPKMAYDFFASGADDQWTLQENERAFQTIRILPRILVDVSKVDLRTSVLGFDIAMPLMIAPTSTHRLAHPDGESATARAAAAVGTIMVVSTSATSSIEEIAQTSPGIRFFQLYVKGSMIVEFAARSMDKSSSWKDVKWLQTMTKLPILIKGVLTVESTEQAIQAGVAGIIVSNHGGRQLDHVPATISVLEEIVRAARGKIPVFIDGGIRRGTDIFKALALGASGVFVGRPIVFSLAVDGEAGVRKALQIFYDELELTMALAGCCKIEDIKRSCVETERDRSRPISSM